MRKKAAGLSLDVWRSKKPRKMFIIEYITMLEILYHKRDPLITKMESEINSNQRKTIYFF